VRTKPRALQREDTVYPVDMWCTAITWNWSLRDQFASYFEKVTQAERLGEPGAAALFEKTFSLGARYVTGHKHDPVRE